MAKAAVVETNDSSSGLQRVASGPERLTSFLKDVREEMRKVVTPTRAEVQSTTIVVIATVFIFAAYFEIVDLILRRGVDQLFVYLTKH
jgi:preprotein translocase subunit SecE